MQRIHIDEIVQETLKILQSNVELELYFNSQKSFKKKGEGYCYVRSMIFENKIFNGEGEFIAANSGKSFLGMYNKTNNFVSSIKSAFIEAFIKKVKFCPYCWKVPLISFEDKYSKNKNLKRTFELDHFFPKDQYPNLAMNLYNLIPVCSGCNFLKSNQNPLLTLKNWEFLFHPYFWWIKKYKNNFLKVSNCLLFGDKVNFFKDKKVKSHFDYFKLNEIYANAQDTANDVAFIRDKIEKIKAEQQYYKRVKMKLKKEIRKDHYFKNFYPKTEEEILLYANGKLKKDWITGLKI